MSVPEVAHGNARNGIEIAISIGAPQPSALATLKRHGQPRIGGHDLTGHRNTPSENKKGSPGTALRKKQGADYSEKALKGKKNVIF
jgi:hypothetical protein